MPPQIPPSLLSDIGHGRVVLLLGAGASFGAVDPSGRQSPSSTELRDALSNRFLGGGFKDQDLSYVADLAVSQSSIPGVQSFVADLLRDLRPAPFHLLLPTFRWRAIATLNYDTVLEAAYSQAHSPVQHLVSFISDDDQIDERLRDHNSLPLIKVHGCISRAADSRVPLILTTDSYALYRSSREYVFRFLEDLLRQWPAVMIGTSGRDVDIRSVFKFISSNIESRPRFFLVQPGLKPEEIAFWESKRITYLDSTFEEFLHALDTAIPAARRVLLRISTTPDVLKRRFLPGKEASPQVDQMLADTVEHVHSSMPIGEGNPKDFYRGFNQGWYPIARRLDVQRRLVSELLYDNVARPDSERPSLVEFYVVRAEAGAGKSVALRRLAWDAACDGDKLCFFIRADAEIAVDPLLELASLVGERVFLFVEKISAQVRPVRNLLDNARKGRVPLTVFAAERKATWNVTCQSLSDLVTDFYDLRYLSESEIRELVTLLRQHDSLGKRLEPMSDEECAREFKRQSGRQLLVALHEATLGRRFEDIIEDEYKGLIPAEARQLYLTVCVLNRLDIPVRAGVIARVHGISFGDFAERFFLPLEHVVSTSENPAIRDHFYVARHPEIAQMVFERVLRDGEDRHLQYARILDALTPSYSSDRAALRGLLQARSLAKLFADPLAVEELFRIGERTSPDDAYILQQRANYERVRQSGNLSKAEQYLERAMKLSPRDMSIVHTLSELYLKRGRGARSRLEREESFRRAESLSISLLRDSQSVRHARHTLAKVAIARLEDTIADPDATALSIDDRVRGAEEVVRRGLQEFPGDPFLLTSEAALGRLLRDDERVLQALIMAHKANRRDIFIATRLASTLDSLERHEEAVEVIHEALEASPGDKHLNFMMASLLRTGGPEPDYARALFHYRRSFSEGDTNLEAQFWFARLAHEIGNEEEKSEASRVFRRLREVPMRNRTRHSIRDNGFSAGDGGRESGVINSLEASYGFVIRDLRGERLFAHRRYSTESWGAMRPGIRVSLKVGYCFSGPVAVDLKKLA